MKENRKTVVQITIKARSLLLNRMAFIGVVTSIFLFTACLDRNEEANLLLNENEICFNEKLVSITKNGENYYIGTESSGRIYVYSSKINDVIDTLNTQYVRIYQVKQAKEANSFYVGTQNMGLKKTHKEGDSLITDTTYFIKGKIDRYSCYDVFFDNEVVYAMTSHGVFNVVKSDTLSSIYTDDDENEVPKPFVASSMVKANDSSLFAATAKGLVRIRGNSVDTIIKNKNVNNVVFRDNYIFALSDSLYRIVPSGKRADSLKIDKYALKAPAKCYYYADGIHYFLSDSYMILVHDEALQNLEQHKVVNTRRKLSLEGHNVIADSKDYSLLITDCALWKVGHHLPSVFGELKGGGVVLACTDGKAVYFLVGKKVYKLDAGNVAKEILELTEKGEIKFMECSSDSIYYVNSEDEVFRQSFREDKPELMGNSPKPKEITAMCRHESVTGVILGIRDGLISMDMTNVRKNFTLKISDSVNDTIPYIRRISVEGDSIYVPTMNEGLFYGRGMTLKLVPNTESLKFIRDVAYTGKDYKHPYILTNRHLILRNHNKIENENYGSRLLISRSNITMIYIPGEVGGVRTIILDTDDKMVADATLFPDIAFRAESSVMHNDTAYLGGQSGVIALSFRSGEPQYQYVKFEDKKTNLSYFYILIGVAIVVPVVLFVLFLRERIRRLKAKDANVKRLRKRCDDINSLLKKYDNDAILQQYQIENDNISDSIETLKNKSPLSIPDDDINKISKRLSELNENIHEHLNLKKKAIEEKANNLNAKLKQANKNVKQRVKSQILRLNNYLIEIQSQLKDEETSQKYQNEIDGIRNEIDEMEKKSLLSIHEDNIEKIFTRLSELNKNIHEHLNKKAIEEKANDMKSKANQDNEKVKKKNLLSQSKNTSEKPRETMTFKRKSWVLDGHLFLLFLRLTKAGWISGEEEKFKALFSGRFDEECQLTWTGEYGKATLVELFKEMVATKLIIVPDGFTLPAILEGHFKDANGNWLTGLDKGNKPNDKALPFIEKSIESLKVDPQKALNGSYQDDEEFSTKYDPHDHQDMHLHKR